MAFVKDMALNAKTVDFKESENVFSILEKHGVPRNAVAFNGKLFSFPFRGMKVQFICLQDKVVGEIFRWPETEEERFLMCQPSTREDFIQRDFDIPNSPEIAAEEIMKAAEELSRKTGPEQGMLHR